MSTDFNIHDYDTYVVTFSGGKDSTAVLLHLLDLGIPKEKIELWHHLVDGSGSVFMDWECTEDYCREFAKAFGIRIYFSWKEGGFEREMLRDNSRTAPNFFETPEGLASSGGKTGNGGTRLKFPQVSPDLSVRWCSAYLKIDVGTAAVTNQSRFLNKRTLILSGERAEESPARAKYKFFEPDRSDNRGGSRVNRHVDRCRIIHNWSEADVWGIIERWKVIVHPCYYLGYGRCSCKWCIFGNANQFATSYALSKEQGQKISAYEQRFGATIKRNESIDKLIERGIPYKGIELYPALAKQSVSTKYICGIFTNSWKLPLGAFGENAGPL